MVDVQYELRRELHGARPCSDKRAAPNGQPAVELRGLWVGYLCEEGGGSRGGGSRSMALFEVEVIAGNRLRATFRETVTGKEKRDINKRIYHKKEIQFVGALTSAGDRCQLFTL